MKIENLKNRQYEVIRYSEPWREKTYVSMTGKSREEWRYEFIKQILSTKNLIPIKDAVNYVDELLKELEITSDFEENV